MENDALHRLLERKRIAMERARMAEAANEAAAIPGPRRDIRVRYFPSSENRGRATRGAEPIAGQTKPKGHSR